MELWSKGVMECKHFFSVSGKDQPRFSNHWNSHTPRLPHSTTPSLRSGLTLIEVMLAIVILGVGAGTLLVATARCMAVATKAKHYSNAHRLLQRVDTEKPLTRGEVEDGIESGKFEDGYSWEREILESENEDREGLYTVRTRVRWSTRGRDAFEEITTYLYVPPEEESTSFSGSRSRSSTSRTRSSSSRSSTPTPSRNRSTGGPSTP